MTQASVLAVAAEETVGATSIEGMFLQYGLIGAIAFALGIYALRTIKATEARAQRLEEDNRRLYQIMAEQMIPALTKATDAVGDATIVMAEIRKQAEIDAAVESARQARGRHVG